MTNYNERLDGVLEDLGDYHEHLYDNMWLAANGEYTKNDAKQAITLLIKELVAEAKPSKKHVGDEVAENRSYTGERLFNATIDEYHTNLLKALEEK